MFRFVDIPNMSQSVALVTFPPFSLIPLYPLPLVAYACTPVTLVIVHPITTVSLSPHNPYVLHHPSPSAHLVPTHHPPRDVDLVIPTPTEISANASGHGCTPSTTYTKSSAITPFPRAPTTSTSIRSDATTTPRASGTAPRLPATLYRRRST